MCVDFPFLALSLHTSSYSRSVPRMEMDRDREVKRIVGLLSVALVLSAWAQKSVSTAAFEDIERVRSL